MGKTYKSMDDYDRKPSRTFSKDDEYERGLRRKSKFKPTYEETFLEDPDDQVVEDEDQ